MYTDSLELQIPGQMTNVTSSEMKMKIQFQKRKSGFGQNTDFPELIFFFEK